MISTGGLPVSGKVTDATRRSSAPATVVTVDDAGRRRRRARTLLLATATRVGDDDGGDQRRRRRGATAATAAAAFRAALPAACRPAAACPTSGGLPGAPAPCTIADLKPGAIVHEAELKLTANGPVWDEITLVRPAVPAA